MLDYRLRPGPEDGPEDGPAISKIAETSECSFDLHVCLKSIMGSARGAYAVETSRRSFDLFIFHCNIPRILLLRL